MRYIKKISIIFVSISLFMVGCSKKSLDKIELNISVAASLKDCMLEIEKEYEKENSKIDLVLNFGSSGSLKQQITQGAPCDIFISASKSYMEELKKENNLLENEYIELLKNKLVLISKINYTNSIYMLKDNKIKNIAIGEIKSVPAGQYANEVLNNTNIKKDIENKLVYAKDVKEVLAWVKSENAEAGFVYYSDIVNDKELKIYKIDENLYSSIIYPVGIIKDSKNKEEAKLFEKYLNEENTKDIFEKYGYIK